MILRAKSPYEENTGQKHIRDESSSTSGTNISKALVAYFSRTGDNYVNGRIVNLTIGNTEIAAEMIKELTGSTMYHIKPMKSLLLPDRLSSTS
ncbi:MAG: hypothetical protein WB588_08660 [Dehalococcoidia bacterium]|jgi:hypothetical protein